MGIAAGRIVGLEYRGRVIVLIVSVRSGHSCPVYLDQDSFMVWLSATGLNHPDELVGREIELTATTVVGGGTDEASD